MSYISSIGAATPKGDADKKFMKTDGARWGTAEIHGRMAQLRHRYDWDEDWPTLIAYTERLVRRRPELLGVGACSCTIAVCLLDLLLHAVFSCLDNFGRFSMRFHPQ